MKYLLEIILTTIIIFFVWNMLKRFFGTLFYRSFTPPKNNPRKETPRQENNKGLNTKINWDAETVEYEEIKEDHTQNK